MAQADAGVLRREEVGLGGKGGGVRFSRGVQGQQSGTGNTKEGDGDGVNCVNEGGRLCDTEYPLTGKQDMGARGGYRGSRGYENNNAVSDEEGCGDNTVGTPRGARPQGGQIMIFPYFISVHMKFQLVLSTGDIFETIFYCIITSYSLSIEDRFLDNHFVSSTNYTGVSWYSKCRGEILA